MRLNDDDFLSVLNFLERSDLETVSISADSTHTTVTANSGRLPLRHIHYAKAVAGKMEMSFERRHNGERQLDTFTVARMEDFIQRLRGSYTKSVLIVGYELWEDRVRFVIDASSDWRAESLTFIQASFHISLQPRQGQPPLLSEMLTKINGLKNIDVGA